MKNRRTDTLGIVALFALLLLTSIRLGWAADSAFKETWIINNNPTELQFKKWKSTSGPTELRVLLTSQPNALMPELLGLFPKVTRLQVGFTLFPTTATLETWKKVLLQGQRNNVTVELISTSGELPSHAHIDLLNQLAPSRVIFVFGRYLKKHEEEVFKGAKFKYSMSFNLNRYPEFLEKFPIAELPKDVPIQIVADYWPRYVQMDIWNLIPQTEKRLRITNSIVSPGNLPYLFNMKDMKELIFQSDGDVMSVQWERLEHIPVRWVAQGAVPSETSLKGFYDSLHFGAQRRLVIDRDTPLTPLERERLVNSKLDVEWIHAAP